MLTALDAPSEALDSAERSFVAKIREHGWFRTGVFADAGGPGFSYTTGFWRNAGRPELIMFGMRDEIAHDIFWDLYRDALAGTDLPVGKRAEDIFGNAPAYVFPVARRHYKDHLGWNCWFYAGDEFPCLQIVWPDRAGLFPWEDRFDRSFEASQVDLTEKGWRSALAD